MEFMTIVINFTGYRGSNSLISGLKVYLLHIFWNANR